ncbi:replicative helicase loader/inhibitor [Listeria seeligeri]|uniref:replicative helicase loader/inhibitor n=1 Tax=Listeria seeligeri TaxID=1640 RepID=UPI0022EA7821|nr:replicative helicase loader/inhibitor [Listeria seeligeri]
MNRIESIELMSIISDVYTNFELNERKIETWIELLREGDFQKSKTALIDYIKNQKFPPAIADFLVSENNSLKKTNELISKIFEEKNTNPLKLEDTDLPDDFKKAVLEYRKKKNAKLKGHLSEEQLVERKNLLKEQREYLLKKELMKAHERN